MGIVQNAVSEKVVTLQLDAVVLVATDHVSSRMKLYNRLADLYGQRFGNVYKNFTTLTGMATIIISHTVPMLAQQSLVAFATSRSSTK